MRSVARTIFGALFAFVLPAQTAGILIVAALALPVSAQTPVARLSLRELISEAIRGNPEIVAAQKSYEAARQRPTQESSLPDPMISLGWVSVGNPWPGAGLGSQVLS